MGRATVRDLHINTSKILEKVAAGDTIVVEKRGVPVAEIVPLRKLDRVPMPNREALIKKIGGGGMDSTQLVSEDRD